MAVWYVLKFSLVSWPVRNNQCIGNWIDYGWSGWAVVGVGHQRVVSYSVIYIKMECERHLRDTIHLENCAHCSELVMF